MSSCCCSCSCSCSCGTYVGEDELDQVQRQLLCVRRIGVRARRRREPAVYGRRDGPLGLVEVVRRFRSGGSSMRMRMRSACASRGRRWRVVGHGRLMDRQLQQHNHFNLFSANSSTVREQKEQVHSPQHVPSHTCLRLTTASSRSLNDPSTLPKVPYFPLAVGMSQPPMPTTLHLPCSEPVTPSPCLRRVGPPPKNKDKNSDTSPVTLTHPCGDPAWRAPLPCTRNTLPAALSRPPCIGLGPPCALTNLKVPGSVLITS